ncbi:hypothetical protein HPP92_022130 [Vanilla planifolia]|uniref:BAG domain-containing protein n=1 Tax=Vanilla planifolia TaxID=51239 RepID=A0A835PWU8_VANPL|nr:hypothetical protein HPP92_022436 [Vanilla planifolia]KAG0459002.1 hypothetical protein HPP92_022130 [Vanilla planifolia]
MSFSRRFELFESALCGLKVPSLLPFPFEAEDMALDEDVGFALDVLCPSPLKASLVDLPHIYSHCFDSWLSDRVSIPLLPFADVVRRAETELQLRSLSDRVAALEVGLERAGKARDERLDRKYKWTAEIKGAEGEEASDRKYKLVAKATVGGERSVKWMTEVNGKGSYTFEASTVRAPASSATGKEKIKNAQEEKKKKKKQSLKPSTKLVEIEEQNPREIIIKKAFARRTLVKGKGKRKELSPQDAAVLIQLCFRAYLVRRSQIIRSLRDLAVAKAKLKEIRSLFHNLSYRRQIARDAEEHQRFTEKIIVLLLTVDSIQGPDYMVRAAKKSIIDELETMLDVVDPQPSGKLGSMKRRKFDLPEGGSIGRAMAMSVAKVVELLDDETGEAV